MAKVENLSPDVLMIQENLEDWVISLCENWRNNYESNYAHKFDEYYRLWRGIWNPNDTERASDSREGRASGDLFLSFPSTI